MATIPYNHHSPLGSPSPVGYLSQKLRSPASPYSNHNTGFQTVAAPGERPYVCPHCSADFIRQSNLSVHMMKVHGEAIEIKTHQCSYCDKKFKYPNKRRLHEMTHTGEKPNVCQFCSMGFFKKSRLRVHLTKHHGISEAEVNNPNSTLFAPPQTAQTTQVQQSYYLSSRLPVEETDLTGDLFCQYCHKPFSTKAELLTHEQAEAMEFEQLHQIFEGNEFTGLGGDPSQNDIIQNALLTAGIENGLTSPSVTDSDSVVTISEADINSFSIGFIPDSSWTSQDGQTLSQTSTPSTDPFYPTSLPSDLTQTTEQSQVNQPTTNAEVQQTLTTSFVDITEPIKVENNPYPNMTGEINQLWETTEAQSSVSQNIISTTLNSIQTEPLLTSTQTENFVSTSVGFNGIYTESTYTMSNDVTLPADAMYTPVITQNQGIAALSTTTDVDFRSFSKLPTSSANYASIPTHGQQNYIDLDGLSTTTLVAATTNGIAQNRITTTTTGRTTEAWIDDPTLPAGWKTRQHFREQSPLSSGNKIDTYYMSPEGRQFRSKWRIVEFMEASGTYCKEEIEWVKGAIQTPRPAEPLRGTVQQQPPKERSDKLKRNWKEDDPTVPKGWKIAWTTTSDNRSKIAFMSPDKRIFHSRKAAIQHMMQAGTYDPDDIVKMTSGLNVLLNVGKEWLTGDDTLPPGWKIRSHRWWCQKRNSYRIHYEFLSPQNEFFKSRKAVVEHMVQSGNYNQDEIEKVKAQNAPSQPDKNSKKKPSAISRQDLSPCNPLIGWKTGNTTLPPGWKIKRHEYANQTVYFYMSPKGDIIKSRRAVMDYMFDDGSYSETDFNAVISGAKQRKVALQEMYDARTGTKKKKRVRKFIPDDDKDLDHVNEDQNTSECEEKENEEDAEGNTPKLEDKKAHKKQIVQKEIPMPTRRSRRFASRAEAGSKEDSDSEMEPEQKKIRLRQSKTKNALSEEVISEGSPATSITELIDSPEGVTDMVDLAAEMEEDQTIDFEDQGFADSMASASILQAKLEESNLDSKQGIVTVDSKAGILEDKQKMEDVQEIINKVQGHQETTMVVIKEEKQEVILMPKPEVKDMVKTEVQQV